MERRSNLYRLINAFQDVANHELPGIAEKDQLIGFRDALKNIHFGLDLSVQHLNNKTDISGLGLEQFPPTWEDISRSIRTLTEMNITGDVLADILINKWGYRVTQTALILDRANFKAEVIPNDPETIEVTSWPIAAEDAFKTWVDLLKPAEDDFQVKTTPREPWLIEVESVLNELTDSFLPRRPNQKDWAKVGSFIHQAFSEKFRVTSTPTKEHSYMSDKGEQFSRAVRRNEANIFNFWDGKTGKGVFPSDEKLRPSTQETFPKFTRVSHLSNS